MERIVVPLLGLALGFSLEAVFITADWNKRLKKAAWFKGMASFCFVAFGGLLAKANPSDAGWYLFLGLISGMMGDICLAVKKFLSGASAAIINVFGILSFMAGHIFYITGLCHAGNPNLLFGCILWIAIYVPVNIFLLKKSKKSPLNARIMGCVYLAAVTFMSSTAVALLSIQQNLFSGLFAAGGLLFLISDIITMYNATLSEKPRTLRAVNLAVYYAAQVLISSCIYYF